MKIITIQELKPYTYNEIINWLNVDEEEAQKAIDSLILYNIVKKLSSSERKLELENLLEVDYYEDIEKYIDKNMYVFNYVGMVMVGDSCFFIYPKYIQNIKLDKENNYKKFKQILSVIRKYESKNQLLKFDGLQESREFNLLMFALELLHDYYENGLYYNDKYIIEENGFGEILWEKTINEKNVYFSNGSPIYLDLYTVNNIINEEDLFRRLHRCIISIVSENIKEILNILGMEKISISTERIEDFGSKEYLIYEIKQELSQQFITSKQQVLYKILTYLNKEEIQNSARNISFVGTNSFNLIWESVCSHVMDNSLNKTLSELNLKPIKNNKSSDRLIDIVPNPKWKHNLSKKEHKAKQTLTPDLITVSNGKMSIYDAKYYKTILNENEVKHQPGVADITKQYLYELAYREFAKQNNLEINKNAFLLPTDNDEEQILGIASIDLFPVFEDGIKLNDIEIILKPCVEMFEKYLNS